MDAIRYVCDNGVKWRALPTDFPPWSTVYGFFSTWTRDMVWPLITDRLRSLARANAGRRRRPSAGCIDAQSVPESAEGVVGKDTSGFDPHKKVNGRKRHIVVDVLGFLLSVIVTPANTQDRDAAKILLARAAQRGVRHAWADSAYRSDELADYLKHHHDLNIQIVERPHPGNGNGFHVVARRWVVERTFAWITRRRRCARDYERLPRTHEAWAHIASAFTTIRRLACTTTRPA